MKFGVLVFPGSNCDHDTYNVVAELAHQPVTFLWHDSASTGKLRRDSGSGRICLRRLPADGAIARFSPVMQSVQKFAADGGLVLGICNGFQILCEAGLLPGALMRNAGLQYICKQVYLRTETTDSPFTRTLEKGQVLKVPIGHMEGNYFCDEATLDELRRGDRIVFRYATPEGDVTQEANPNGSLENIAGILNEGRNVLGMMPHPDRSSEALLGSADGFRIFESLVGALAQQT